VAEDKKLKRVQYFEVQEHQLVSAQRRDVKKRQNRKSRKVWREKLRYEGYDEDDPSDL